MHIIRQEIFSLIFEPIVDMSNGKVVGYEGLSRCENSQINTEFFFQTLTIKEHFTLLSLQLQKYQKWVEQHPEFYQGQTLFLNISQDLLLETELSHLFIPYSRYFPINVELDLMKPLTSTHRFAIKKLAKNQGIQLWLDDFIRKYLPITPNIWSGIKLDKSYFWSLIHHKEKLKGLGLPFTADNIICEGVETECQKHAAIALGLRYGQGYLWPAVG